MAISNEYIDETLQWFKKRLIITRLQLEQLKHSINRTLKDIRELDVLLRQTQNKLTQRNPSNQFTQLNPQQSFITLICKKCNQQFPTASQLFSHQKQSHQRCRYCSQVFFQSTQDHQNHLCGAWLIKCFDCSACVKRQNIDKHVKICSFRECHKCYQNVYVKGFAYHLEVCGKEIEHQQQESTESFRKSSSDSDSVENVKISLLPCTVVM